MKKGELSRGTTIGSIVVLFVLLCLSAFGAFGSNCQQLTVDILNDMRSNHVTIHE